MNNTFPLNKFYKTPYWDSYNLLPINFSNADFCQAQCPWYQIKSTTYQTFAGCSNKYNTTPLISSHTSLLHFVLNGVPVVSHQFIIFISYRYLSHVQPPPAHTFQFPWYLHRIYYFFIFNVDQQENRLACQSRAKSVLRQWENLPFLVELHRHFGLLGCGFIELRRPGWKNQCWFVHIHCHVDHGLRIGHLPLESQGYPVERLGPIWWQIWPYHVVYLPFDCSGGQLCVENPCLVAIYTNKSALNYSYALLRCRYLRRK